MFDNPHLPLYVMQSNGGVMSASAAADRPIHIIESGPAAGIIAALTLAERVGIANVLTLDMGGTTAKASLIEDGQVTRSPEYQVGGGVSVGIRLSRGGGYPLRVPAKYLDKITSLFFNYLLLVILRSAAKPVPSLRSRTSSKLAAGKNLMP